MTTEYIGDGNTDGTIVGKTSSDKLAFFGGTASVRASLTTVASSATVATCAASLVEIIAELRSKGLVG